jgi:hypothetical protein
LRKNGSSRRRAGGRGGEEVGEADGEEGEEVEEVEEGEEELVVVEEEVVPKLPKLPKLLFPLLGRWPGWLVKAEGDAVAAAAAVRAFAEKEGKEEGGVYSSSTA